MSSLANTTLNFKSFCKINFKGGDLSSHCGLLLLGQFMENMGITSFLKKTFSDDALRQRKHNKFSIVSQLILQKILGYCTDDAADHLAYRIGLPLNLLYPDFFMIWIMVLWPILTTY